MPNRLSEESSPYLLQHQTNPVDWYPWGEEAIQAAKERDKPIFLSIGYSACHWCHVMEHESFENDEVAAVMNDKFICVKVDREERPDLDQIYMNAVQVLTGHGGWPMSVFLTPDLKPFFGGTYWPPEPRMKMPGFQQVLAAVDDAWQNRREKVLETSEDLTSHLQKAGVQEASGTAIDAELLRGAGAKLEQAFDFTHGGFGRAPKFPHSMDVQLLMRIYRRHPRQGILDMVKLTLDKMAAGGIYDHLAGGFARYSVDERWLVPHFEKMLYDNALLADAYLDAYVVLEDERYATVVRETFDYQLKYMTDEGGGFHSTEDADSEGVEGKFYVWSPSEIDEILGAEKGARFCYVYDVTESGNFEGKSILNLPKTIEQCASLRDWDVDELKAELAESRRALLDARDQRVRPGKDDKVLVSWNALMIHAMARGSAILQRPEWLEAAANAALFIKRLMRRDGGRLLHSYRLGTAKFDAYLDDYAYLVNGLVSLYEASFDESWIEWAVELADTMLDRFADSDGGGFYFTADDHEELIARNKDVQDASVPSGNAMAATALMRLGKLTGKSNYLDAVQSTLEMAVGFMEQAPTAAGQMLIAADMYLGPFSEVVVSGHSDDVNVREAIANYWQHYTPNCVVGFRDSSTVNNSLALLDPLFAGKETSGDVHVFQCQDFACQQPAVGVDAVKELWQRLAAVDVE